MSIALYTMVAVAACYQKPTKKECEAAARRRVHYFFGAGKEKDTGSARQTKRSAKMEFEASMDDCAASWSKDKAICIANAKNRNMMIRCR